MKGWPLDAKHSENGRREPHDVDADGCVSDELASDFDEELRVGRIILFFLLLPQLNEGPHGGVGQRFGYGTRRHNQDQADDGP